MAMKPEFKKVWVEALRSGEFKQGKGTLKNGHGNYCCLGVACVTWQGLLPELELRPTHSTDYSMEAIFKNEGRTTTLPFTLVEAVAMPELATATLVDLNDQGKSFAEIADYIEANL